MVGRRVGSAKDFSYSPAIANLRGKWTKDRLDAFLANPRGAVPGTTMEFDGISDQSQREQLIAFLARQRR